MVFQIGAMAKQKRNGRYPGERHEMCNIVIVTNRTAWLASADEETQEPVKQN